MSLTSSQIVLTCTVSGAILLLLVSTVIYFTHNSWKVVSVVLPQTQSSRVHVSRVNTSTPKVLHLVLWSGEPAYNDMRDITLPYYQQFEPHVRTLYYGYSPHVREVTVDKERRLLLFPGKECFLPCILFKTVQALEYTKDWDYQFVVRSNASTVVNWRLLLHLLATTCANLQYGGGFVMKAFERDGRVIKALQCFGSTFVQGTGVILGRQTVEWLLNNTGSLRFDLQDDLALGKLVKHAPFVNRKLYSMRKLFKQTSPDYVLTAADMQKFVFFRNKTSKGRQGDVQRMQSIVNGLAADIPKMAGQ